MSEIRTATMLLEAMLGYLAEHVYLPAGCGVVADEVAALWQPAGVSVGDEFWVEHGEAFDMAIEGQMDRLGVLAAAMDEHHPADDCWYLLAFGVRPAAQGRGLGGRTLALEATSPRSRALYERHGFEVTGEFLVDDSPPMWPMWRPPSQRGR